jgi:RNA polymerase sigma-70 factor (ECF subfamily)
MMTIEQLTEEFERAKPRLKSYIFRITASKEDTEDIIQDTFIRGSQKIENFRGDASFSTWIFTIASNLAKDNLRARKRWTENVTEICRAKAIEDLNFRKEVMNVHASSPQGQFEIKEHITFCFTCISKSLPLEQQICILLKEVYDFKVLEITEILNTSEAMVKYYLHTSRSKMISIFDGKCALINKEGTCHQCSELNGIFNPKQNFEIEKNKIEMVKSVEKGDKNHLLDLRLKLMKEIDPFLSHGSALQLHHLEYNSRIMEEYQ